MMHGKWMFESINLLWLLSGRKVREGRCFLWPHSWRGKRSKFVDYNFAFKDTEQNVKLNEEERD